MTLYSWSSTAAANGTADATINMAEGMAPSAVNDGARAMMAAVAKADKDWGGGLATGGNATTYTLTTNQNFDTLAHLNNNKVKVRFHAANGAAPTLNIDSLGSTAIQVASGTAVGAGVIGANSIWDLTYNSTIPAFLLSNVPAAIQSSTVTSTSIAAGAVQYANFQNVASNSLIGNPSSTASAAPQAITISTGLTISGSSLKSAYPPAGAYRNLVIKVASNTTVSVTADYVTTTDGTTFQTTAVSSTVNLGTTGADALDTGTIAADSWYYIYVIAKSDGTTKCVASLQSTPNGTFTAALPAGYTFYARIGAVRTIHATATLYGTWQLGRRAVFVQGLAQTAGYPNVASGALGNITTPVWSAQSITSVIPVTASEIHVVVGQQTSGNITICAASSNYGGATNSTNPPAGAIANNSGVNNILPLTMTLENASNIYYASGGAGGYVNVVGWTDNI